MRIIHSLGKDHRYYYYILYYISLYVYKPIILAYVSYHMYSLALYNYLNDDWKCKTIVLLTWYQSHMLPTPRLSSPCAYTLSNVSTPWLFTTNLLVTTTIKTSYPSHYIWIINILGLNYLRCILRPLGCLIILSLHDQT